MFSDDRRQVVLIRKKKPAWQAGKLNGVGGKINQGEGARPAMVREFEEETGILVGEADWRKVVELRAFFKEVDGVSGSCTIHFFVNFSSQDTLEQCRTTAANEGDIEIHYLDYLRSLDGSKQALAQLRWILPMCAFMESDPRVSAFHITELA